MTIKTLSRRITNDLSFEILLPEQSFLITLSLAFSQDELLLSLKT